MRPHAAALALALTTAALGLGVRGELEGRARPVPPHWLEDLHPLLGAAPPHSFAREADADPWTDFRGRPFPRRTLRKRVLLVGGAAAGRAAPRIEASLDAESELVVAAREGYRVAQETILVGRFAPVLSVSAVIALDGEELTSARTLDGWTPEWDWQRAAIASPLGEALAERSGLARSIFVEREPGPSPLGEVRPRYLRGVRSLAALAAAQHVRLLWTFVPDESLPASAAHETFDAGVAATRGRAEASRGLDALLETLRTRPR